MERVGRPPLSLPGDWRAIEVPQVTLSDLLADHAQVDLVDFDTQGSEADCIEEAIAPLNAKVKRLHIGTHGPEIEDRIVAALSGEGWTCLRRFNCLRVEDTPLGPIEFNDGVQSWLNPRLA